MTPYELQLGLDARDWDSTYITNIESLRTAREDNYKHDIMQEMLNRVVLSREEAAMSSSESEEDEKHIDEIIINSNNSDVALSTKSETRIANRFESFAGNFLSGREYQGLSPESKDDLDTSVKKGQFGIAISYEK